MRHKQEPRMYGHVDAIDAHHMGPEARWAKQARRAAKAAAIQAAKRAKQEKADAS
jgi:hypothetical protein